MGPRASLDGCGKSLPSQRDSIPGPKNGTLRSEVHLVTCHERTKGENRCSCTVSLTSGLDEIGWSTKGLVA